MKKITNYEATTSTIDSFITFDNFEWEIKPKIEKEIHKFGCYTNCQCSEISEDIEFGFKWSQSREERDGIIKEKLDKWILENVSSYSKKIDEE